MTAESLARALKARRSGSCWMANCPAHDDSTPSLSISTGRDGHLLVHCHAGCRQTEVIAALRQQGLWSESEQTRRVITATYNYTDEAGSLLYQVVRYEPKDFKQRRPDGAGDWIWRKGERQVLYRLPDLLDAPIVFVVEGERDAETLRDQGFVATTNAGGADAPWLPAYTDTLQGREVILIPDNDDAGRKRAGRIARALRGKVARLVVLELEGVGIKDVTDWFRAGHSELELISLIDGAEVTS